MVVAIIFNNDVHSFLDTILFDDSIGQNVLNMDMIDPVPVIKESSVDLENLKVALFFSCAGNFESTNHFGVNYIPLTILLVNVSIFINLVDLNFWFILLLNV